MSFSGAAVLVLVGGVALFALVSAVVACVRHVRKHRALFTYIAADVADLRATAKRHNLARQHTRPYTGETHQLAADAGHNPLGSASVASQRGTS